MTIPARRGAWILTLALTLTAALSGAAHAGESAPNGAAVKELFAQPPRGFSSAPLWVWNDLLTEEEIVGTLRDLAGQNVKQVFVHPRPGLMTPYLSAEWFRLWKAALAEAARLDMNIWIYDENSYPSGFAGGLVPQAMPEARGRGLVFRETKSVGPWQSGWLAVYRLGGPTAEDVSAQARSGAGLPAGQTYLVASVQRAANSPWNAGGPYVDLIHPGVTEKFLDITLGAYQREIGDQFGRRVPGIFTDEPNLIPAGGWPWTDDLPEQFQKRWGYDLLTNLASLHFSVGDWKRVRHDYFSTLNQLFIERWARPYAERCAQLGLEMTGHYWEHEWPNCRPVPDNMAMYAWPQRPAIDCLMNQYAEHTHAQFGNLRSVRELGSVANQLGKARTLCEVYGAGGWDLRFEDMKRQADWLGVLGVNTFDQHLSYVTIRGARKRDHPQSFSYHEPWWSAYGACGTYLQRLSVAVSQGEQVNSILVLEPTTTAWMYQGDDAALNALGDSFFQLLRSLEAAQIEYDLGCEDILARHGAVRGRELIVGRRAYRMVVLPPRTENLDGRTWDLLNEYVANGGQVLACTPQPPGYLPRRDGALGLNDAALSGLNPRWDRIDAAAVPERLRAVSEAGGFGIARAADDRGILFHMRRQLADGELVFLVNTSLTNRSAGRFWSARHNAEEWKLETGKTEAYGKVGSPRRPEEMPNPSLRPARATLTPLEAEFDLPPCGSLLLFLSDAPRTTAPAAARTDTRTPLEAVGPLQIRRVEPNVLVLDYVDVTAGGETRTNLYVYQAGQFAFRKNGMARNPWDSAVQFRDELIRRTFPAESGFSATYRFTIEQSVPANLEVVVERPDLYTITCNGQELRAKAGAWWLDRSFGRIGLGDAARVGTNELTLRAAPFTIYHELESIYVRGEFRLRPAERGFVVVPEVAGDRLEPGWWNAQGCPFYGGAVRYEQTFRLSASGTERAQYELELGKWYGSVVKVTVNGEEAGIIGWAPWSREVTSLLRPGENRIAVEVIGTLKNTLGPHHGNPGLGSAWPGMFQNAVNPGPPPGAAYSTVGYGMTDFKLLKR